MRRHYLRRMAVRRLQLLLRVSGTDASWPAARPCHSESESDLERQPEWHRSRASNSAAEQLQLTRSVTVPGQTPRSQAPDPIRVDSA